MKYISKIKSIAPRAAIHLLFWIAIFFFYYYVYSRVSGNSLFSFIHTLLSLPIAAAAVYISIYNLIPKLIQKKYAKFFVGAYYVLLMILFFELVINFYFLFTPMEIEGRVNPAVFDVYLRTAGILLIVFFASVITLVERWYFIQQKTVRLEKEKLEAELKILKAQLNPHFLFNTLNNLYALALKKSEESPRAILKLSGMLDYILYQTDKKNASLADEINFIQNYIDLEKLRFSGGRLKVKIEIDEELRELKTPPLLFFPLVENCFKHGIDKTNGSADITLRWREEESQLLFTARNKIYSEETGRRKGVGIDNVRKRLQLYYEDEHSFDINTENEYFIVNIKLPLKD